MATVDPELEAIAWERLMAAVVSAAEEADYSPGNLLPPGSGREGDEPNPDASRYAAMGHLALVLNEAVDAAVHAGADRDALLDQVVHLAGAEREVIDAILSGQLLCPPELVLQAFANAVAIDPGIVLDAAIKGGCKGYTGMPSSGGVSIP